MNKKISKKITCVLLASLMLFTSTSYAFASNKKNTFTKVNLESIKNIELDSNTIDSLSRSEISDAAKSIEAKEYKEELMSAKEEKVFNSIVEDAIRNTDDVELTEENIEAVKLLLRDDTTVINNGNELTLYSTSAAKVKKRPTIRIKTSDAAAAFNTIIFAIAAAATGGAGSAAMNLLIRKMGTAAAKNYIKRRALAKIKNKLIAWGMSHTAKVVDGLFFSAIYNLLDPGTGLANALDRRDAWGQNGYIEI